MVRGSVPYGTNPPCISRKREKVGAHCYSIADDGHVEIDITGKKVAVTTSKTGKHDSYTI